MIINFVTAITYFSPLFISSKMKIMNYFQRYISKEMSQISIKKKKKINYKT